jgi:hypothetical protein
MCGADSSLTFCEGYGDSAKKVADSVLKNKPADPESKQGAAPTRKAAGKSAAASSSASLAVLVLGAAAVALVL